MIFCAQLARFMEANSTKPAPRVNLFGVRKYVIGSRTLLRASSVYTRIYVIIRLRIQWHSIPSFTSVHIDTLFCSTYRNAYKYRRGGKGTTTTTLHFYRCLSLLAVNVDEERADERGDVNFVPFYRFRPFR